MIIDGTDLILGRLAAFAVKRALEGEQVIVVNCEKIIVSGRKEVTFADYKEKIDRGNPFKGPFYSRMPDRLTRRTIRGMLPHKRERGRLAFKRVMCYLGVPEEYKDKKLETIKGISSEKLKNIRYITLKELSANFGKK